MTERYIVTTDRAAITTMQPARLYRLTGYHRAELAAEGTLGQMQTLANELNGEPS